MAIHSTEIKTVRRNSRQTLALNGDDGGLGLSVQFADNAGNVDQAGMFLEPEGVVELRDFMLKVCPVSATGSQQMARGEWATLRAIILLVCAWVLMDMGFMAWKFLG